MEKLEHRRKALNVSLIIMIITPLFYCFVLAVMLKSGNLLADSLQNVQSAEADSTALQWVLQQSLTFKAWTIALGLIEILAICCVAYCLFEWITTKRKIVCLAETRMDSQSAEVLPSDNTQPSQETETEGITKSISIDEIFKSQTLTVEEKVAYFISSYKKQNIIAYVYKWLTDNGCFCGTQNDVIEFAKTNTNKSIASGNMSNSVKALDDKTITKTKEGKEYSLVSNRLGSFIEPNYTFNIEVKINKEELRKK